MGAQQQGYNYEQDINDNTESYWYSKSDKSSACPGSYNSSYNEYKRTMSQRDEVKLNSEQRCARRTRARKPSSYKGANMQRSAGQIVDTAFSSKAY